MTFTVAVLCGLVLALACGLLFLLVEVLELRDRIEDLEDAQGDEDPDPGDEAGDDDFEIDVMVEEAA